MSRHVKGTSVYVGAMETTLRMFSTCTLIDPSGSKLNHSEVADGCFKPTVNVSLFTCMLLARAMFLSLLAIKRCWPQLEADKSNFGQLS